MLLFHANGDQSHQDREDHPFTGFALACDFYILRSSLQNFSRNVFARRVLSVFEIGGPET